MSLLEEFAGCRLGPSAHSADGDYFAALRQVDHDRGDAGEVHLVRFHHGLHDPGSNAGVHGVSAALQDSETGLCGQVMARYSGVPGSANRGPVGPDALDFFLVWTVKITGGGHRSPLVKKQSRAARPR